MQGKLDPGERVAGTDVKLQELLGAPGVSMTLASVLFGRETPRDLNNRRHGKDTNKMLHIHKDKCQCTLLEDPQKVSQTSILSRKQ